jgi:Repeat of unknown function (DUF5648)
MKSRIECPRALRNAMLLLVLGICADASFAASATNGQALYQTWCTGCHGPAINNQNDILLGANNAPAITAAWAGSVEMQYLTAAIPNSAQAAEDIAAYLGTIPGATGGRLQVRGSASLGDVAVGQESTPLTLVVTNTGTAAVNISSVTSSLSSQFPILASSCSGVVAPGLQCKFAIAFLPAVTGSTFAGITITSNGIGSPQTVIVSGVGYAPDGSPAVSTVIEFYNASLDHYFISTLPMEIADLDVGNVFLGWVRTGLSFNAYLPATAGASPVCRFYLPPPYGDSHFYGRGTLECAQTAQNNPGFIQETPEAMDMFLPTEGVCPSNTIPVYRVFDNRPDVNHRYTTDRAVRDQMVAAGWVAEGGGPDLVVMCAPP